MRVFTPKIAEQVISRGWHVRLHEHINQGGISVTEQSIELDYDACVPEAMKMLVEWRQHFSSFQANLRRIDTDIAGMIAHIDSDYVFLPKLEALSASEARRLNRSRGRILLLGLQTEPDTEAMHALINPSRDAPLDLQLPTLSVESARVLSKHTHELYLELPFDAMKPNVAAVLSGYCGYRLDLRLTEFDGIKAHADAVKEILERTPYKRVACIYQSERVVRFETEEKDWKRWERRIARSAC